MNKYIIFFLTIAFCLQANEMEIRQSHEDLLRQGKEEFLYGNHVFHQQVSVFQLAEKIHFFATKDDQFVTLEGAWKKDTDGFELSYQVQMDKEISLQGKLKYSWEDCSQSSHIKCPTKAVPNEIRQHLVDMLLDSVQSNLSTLKDKRKELQNENFAHFFKKVFQDTICCGKQVTWSDPQISQDVSTNSIYLGSWRFSGPPVTPAARKFFIKTQIGTVVEANGVVVGMDKLQDYKLGLRVMPNGYDIELKLDQFRPAPGFPNWYLTVAIYVKTR